MKKILSFDIGGTKIAFALVFENGELASKTVKFSTPATTEAIVALLKKIISQHEDEVDAVAISTAGTVDSQNTKITGSVGNLPEGYGDVDFQALSKKKVFVENDANSAVWAEYKVGHAKNMNNVVLLTLGTGVGVGIVVDGKLLKGKSGAAGETHFPVRQDKHRRCGCGNYDCLEVYMSGSALNLDAKEAYNDDNKTSYDIIQGLEENNHKDIAVFERWQNMVETGVRIFASIFDPDIVLLGGSMAHFINYPLMEKNVNAAIVAAQIVLREAEFENDAGIIGGALLCAESL